MFRASVIPTSKELIKAVNSILYSFIWNGKDKVKRHALISDIEMGGVKMLDIDSMIGATRITCLKKFLEDYQKYLENNSRQASFTSWRTFCFTL